MLGRVFLGELVWRLHIFVDWNPLRIVHGYYCEVRVALIRHGRPGVGLEPLHQREGSLSFCTSNNELRREVSFNQVTCSIHHVFCFVLLLLLDSTTIILLIQYTYLLLRKRNLILFASYLKLVSPSKHTCISKPLFSSSGWYSVPCLLFEGMERLSHKLNFWRQVLSFISETGLEVERSCKQYELIILFLRGRELKVQERPTDRHTYTSGIKKYP